MPPKRKSYNVDEWVRLYEAGEPYEQIASKYGVSAMTVYGRLQERGVGRCTSEANRVAAERRLGHLTLPIIDAYVRGESVISISDRLGVRRPTVTEILSRNGIALRGDANRIRFRDPDERGRAAVRAHLAMGKGERDLLELLLERGHVFNRQTAFGPYNVDLSRGDLAVEVHASATNPFAPSSRERERCVALMRLGLNVIYVWTSGRTVDGSAADEVVAFAEATSGNPAAERQYRVIRSDGELAATGCGEPHELSFVRAPRRRKQTS